MSDPPVSAATSAPPVALRSSALRRALARFARRESEKVVPLPPRAEIRDDVPELDLLAGPEAEGPVSEPPRAQRPSALARRFAAH